MFPNAFYAPRVKCYVAVCDSFIMSITPTLTLATMLGTKLLSLVRVHTSHSNGMAAPTVAEHVTLMCGADAVTVDVWNVLAARTKEKGLTSENYTEQVEASQAIALLDRNAPNLPWRRIFAVRGDDQVYIFDGSSGEPIDEPEDGVPSGITPLRGDEGTFLDDWEKGYYKLDVPDEEPEEEVPPPPPPHEELTYICDTRCIQGARLAIAFEEQWEGCTIDEVMVSADALLLAFDDGDLKIRTGAQIKQDLSEGCLKFISAEQKGIVSNVEGLPSAVRAARHKDGRAPTTRPVGVLVGATEYCLAGEVIFQSFFVDIDAFKEVDVGGTRRAAATTAQDRLGIHTVRRGDIVRYQYLSDGEQCNARVFGVTWPAADPGRKFLLLQEISSRAFLAGGYTDWRRVHTKDDSNVDDDSTALTCSAPEFEQMNKDWEAGDKLASLDTHKKVSNSCRNLPPHLRDQRAEAARLSKAEEVLAKKRESRAAAIARAKGARGKGGKGGKGGKNLAGRALGAGNRLPINVGDTPDTADSESEDETPISRRLRQKNGSGRGAALSPAAADPAATDKGKQADEMRALRAELARAKQQLLSPPQQQGPPPFAAATGVETPTPPAAVPRDLPPGSFILPPGWRMAVDNSGCRYYYNKSLGASTYTLPEAESPPLPPPSKPGPSTSGHISSHGSTSASASGISFESFEAKQRRDRITHIKASLPYCDSRGEKAELNGELATLQREEHMYMQSQASGASRLV